VPRPQAGADQFVLAAEGADHLLEGTGPAPLIT
jgi:hypothetical protein